MPPRCKFKKEEAVEAAVRIIEREGVQAVTARSLGEELGSSARPIFTLFNGMDEVLKETEIFAWKIYEDYLNQGLEEDPPFKGSGKAYIRFAKERPQLFRFLFMKSNASPPDINQILNFDEKQHNKILNSITLKNPLTFEQADKLYRHLWIYSHGIAVLLATKVCDFSEGEISQLLSEVFLSLLEGVRKE